MYRNKEDITIKRSNNVPNQSLSSNSLHNLSPLSNNLNLNSYSKKHFFWEYFSTFKFKDNVDLINKSKNLYGSNSNILNKTSSKRLGTSSFKTTLINNSIKKQKLYNKLNNTLDIEEEIKSIFLGFIIQLFDAYDENKHYDCKDISHLITVANPIVKDEKIHSNIANIKTKHASFINNLNNNNKNNAKKSARGLINKSNYLPINNNIIENNTDKTLYNNLVSKEGNAKPFNNTNIINIAADIDNTNENNNTDNNINMYDKIFNAERFISDSRKDIQPFLEYIYKNITFDIFIQNLNHVVDKKYKNKLIKDNIIKKYTFPRGLKPLAINESFEDNNFVYFISSLNCICNKRNTNNENVNLKSSTILSKKKKIDSTINDYDNNSNSSNNKKFIISSKENINNLERFIKINMLILNTITIESPHYKGLPYYTKSIFYDSLNKIDLILSSSINYFKQNERRNSDNINNFNKFYSRIYNIKEQNFFNANLLYDDITVFCNTISINNDITLNTANLISSSLKETINNENNNEINKEKTYKAQQYNKNIGLDNNTIIANKLIPIFKTSNVSKKSIVNELKKLVFSNKNTLCHFFRFNTTNDTNKILDNYNTVNSTDENKNTLKYSNSSNKKLSKAEYLRDLNKIMNIENNTNNNKYTLPEEHSIIDEKIVDDTVNYEKNTTSIQSYIYLSKCNNKLITFYVSFAPNTIQTCSFCPYCKRVWSLWEVRYLLNSLNKIECPNCFLTYIPSFIVYENIVYDSIPNTCNLNNLTNINEISLNDNFSSNNKQNLLTINSNKSQMFNYEEITEDMNYIIDNNNNNNNMNIDLFPIYRKVEYLSFKQLYKLLIDTSLEDKESKLISYKLDKIENRFGKYNYSLFYNSLLLLNEYRVNIKKSKNNNDFININELNKSYAINDTLIKNHNNYDLNIYNIYDYIESFISINSKLNKNIDNVNINTNKKYNRKSLKNSNVNSKHQTLIKSSKNYANKSTILNNQNISNNYNNNKEKLSNYNYKTNLKKRRSKSSNINNIKTKTKSSYNKKEKVKKIVFKNYCKNNDLIVKIDFKALSNAENFESFSKNVLNLPKDLKQKIADALAEMCYEEKNSNCYLKYKREYYDQKFDNLELLAAKRPESQDFNANNKNRNNRFKNLIYLKNKDSVSKSISNEGSIDSLNINNSQNLINYNNNLNNKIQYILKHPDENIDNYFKVVNFLNKKQKDSSISPRKKQCNLYSINSKENTKINNYTKHKKYVFTSNDKTINEFQNGNKNNNLKIYKNDKYMKNIKGNNLSMINNNIASKNHNNVNNEDSYYNNANIVENNKVITIFNNNTNDNSSIYLSNEKFENEAIANKDSINRIKYTNENLFKDALINEDTSKINNIIISKKNKYNDNFNNLNNNRHQIKYKNINTNKNNNNNKNKSFVNIIENIVKLKDEKLIDSNKIKNVFNNKNILNKEELKDKIYKDYSDNYNNKNNKNNPIYSNINNNEPNIYKTESNINISNNYSNSNKNVNKTNYNKNHYYIQDNE